MTKSIGAFSGFSKNTFVFLSRLEKNNNAVWFNKNRSIYENELVAPAKSFVASIAPFFNQLNPSIRTEPKFNHTLMRINKDMRFAKGEPYKNYFLIHFGRFKMDSEFYVYLDKSGVTYGMFLNNTSGDELYFNQNSRRFRNEIIETSRKFRINNKFDLLTFAKNEPVLVKPKYSFIKNFDEMIEFNYILIEKGMDKSDKKLYSSDFLVETIKVFSRLYAIYCFAISPDPLRLNAAFEEGMGAAV